MRSGREGRPGQGRVGGWRRRGSGSKRQSDGIHPVVDEPARAHRRLHGGGDHRRRRVRGGPRLGRRVRAARGCRFRCEGHRHREGRGRGLPFRRVRHVRQRDPQAAGHRATRNAGSGERAHEGHGQPSQRAAAQLLDREFRPGPGLVYRLGRARAAHQRLRHADRPGEALRVPRALPRERELQLARRELSLLSRHGAPAARPRLGHARHAGGRTGRRR